LDDLNNSTLERVYAIVSDISGLPLRKLSEHTAVDQDLKISGGDVEDLAEALANEFGEQVWQWPWQRFAHLDEGLPIWAPFWLAWRLLTWPIRGRVFDPSPLERLELGHIAAVIDRDEWFDPEVTSA
jgi:hypothetical protein